MHNVRVHKYLLSYINLKIKKINILSIYNLFCKTHTSLQVHAYFKDLLECILKIWFVNFILMK